MSHLSPQVVWIEDVLPGLYLPRSYWSLFSNRPPTGWPCTQSLTVSTGEAPSPPRVCRAPSALKHLWESRPIWKQQTPPSAKGCPVKANCSHHLCKALTLKSLKQPQTLNYVNSVRQDFPKHSSLVT